MVYVQRRPGAGIRPWVRQMWYCRAPLVAHRHERVLPNGCIQIVINLARDYLVDCSGSAETRMAAALIVGPRGRFESIDTGDLAEIAGVVIEPGAFASLFRHRADLFFEKSVALRDVWAAFEIARIRAARTPAEKLACLESMLRARACGAAMPSPMVGGALRFLCRPETTVRECVGESGFSARRFSQIFREQVGVSPKLWARIRRFQRALRRLNGGEEMRWAELAVECGYYDQPHFINDFQAFSGINPARYSALRGPWSNHVAVTL